MLIDTLLNRPIANVDARILPALQRRLSAAAKFELGPDFAAAADGLSNDYTAIAHALPFVRLPFPLVWIEVAQQHRPTFLKARTHLPEVQATPVRVGMLLAATDDTLSRFLAYQFWAIAGANEIGQASHLCMRMDPGAMLSDDDFVDTPNDYKFIEPGVAPGWAKAKKETRAKLVAVVQPETPNYLDSIFVEAILRGGRGAAGNQLIYEMAVSDWSGEAVFLLGTLALMNTVNATEATPVNYGKLNAARAKQRKPPLAEHSVLTIHPRIRRHIVGNADAHGHRELVGHLVRGHWKVRKTGIYFWHPHARGQRKEDAAPKTYRVE